MTLDTQKCSLPVKIHGDSDSLDFAESEYDKHIALSPTGVKEKRLNFKTTSVTNNSTLGFNYNIYIYIYIYIYIIK